MKEDSNILGAIGASIDSDESGQFIASMPHPGTKFGKIYGSGASIEEAFVSMVLNSSGRHAQSIAMHPQAD